MSSQQKIEKIPKQVSLETIKRRLKKIDPQEFPILIRYGGELYWFHSPRQYHTLIDDGMLLHNLREFFALDLDNKQLNKYYEIHREFRDHGNGIVACYNGSYDIGFAGGNMCYGFSLDKDKMIAKIDEYIAKYH